MSAAKRMVLTAHLIGRTLTTHQRFEFGVCAVFKDESRHLGEWLEFHSIMGVEHFFLYDDGSTDDSVDILQPWIEQGLVTLRRSRNRKQKDIYNHCLRHGAARCRWIAFIDIDEFLFSPEASTLPLIMRRYSSLPGVFVHWILFGSNGHIHPPHSGTLSSYTRSMGQEASIRDCFEHGQGGPRSEYVTGWARDGKSIVDPRKVIEMGIHRPHIVRQGSIVNETLGAAAGKTPPGTPFTCNVLRINHYWSRSIDELTAKILRGAVSTSKRERSNLQRSLEREALLNQIEDRLILEVRESMSRSDR